MANCVLEKKITFAAKNKNFRNKASEVSISTEIDLLITNMITFSRLGGKEGNQKVRDSLDLDDEPPTSTVKWNNLFPNINWKVIFKKM